MYVVMGASGHTGSVVAGKLLAAGKQVRVVGRDRKRLDGFLQKGAEAGIADASDAAALAKVFSGATAAYAMVPPNPANPDVRAYSDQVAEAISSAIQASGVKHVVLLSSFGADKAEKTGPVVGLHKLERKLEAIAGLHALFLRAGYFMENLLPQAGVIKSFGNIAGPLKGDLLLPMIATRDIGAKAAELLLGLRFEGKQSRELDGAREVSYDEVAKIIGAAIDKPALRYQQMPGAQLKPFLVQMGMSSNMADLLLEMAEALNSGHMKALEPRSAENSTATTIETFVTEVFMPAYRGTAARV